MLRLLVLTVLALAVAVPQAAAASRVVASEGGLELRAALERGDLCLETSGSTGCLRRPLSPFSTVVLDAVNEPFGVTGAVVPEVASVELEHLDGRRTTVIPVSARGFRERF